MDINKLRRSYVLPYGQMSLRGFEQSLKWSTIVFIILSSFDFIAVWHLIDLTVMKLRVRYHKRVGPHNHDLLCIIYGTLLGDSHAERRSIGNGTRISFYQEHTHTEYLLWLHSLMAGLGYCNPKIPVIQTRLGLNGIIRYVRRFHSFTYTSFNTIHNDWYTNGIKHVPVDIANYLSPLALAIWISDDK